MGPRLPRRRLLRQLALSACALPFVGCATRDEAFGVGLIADPQYADLEPRGRRCYRASIGKLEAAVEDFNRHAPDFCVNLGDTIDRQWSSYEAILRPLGRSRAPWHHLLGNHDFTVAEGEKARVPGLLGMSERYRSFDHRGFCFVLLDTNAVSTYATAEGSAEKSAAAAELDRLKAARRPQAQSWNGGLGSRQLAWMERVFSAARVRGHKVIVLAHHPVAPDGAYLFWDAPEALALLARHRHVVAWFNGHNHDGAFAQVDGLPCVTLHGMVETPDTNAYAFLRIHRDRILVRGVGREPSRELLFRS